MIREEYISFIEKFEGLTPFEVDHFSGLLFKAYTKLLLKTGKSGPIRQEELSEILTQAMHAAHLQIAEKRIDDARIKYDLVRTRLMVED